MSFAELLSRALTACALLALLWAPAQAARDVAPTRECAICHLAWVPDFKRQDVTPLTPYDPRPMMPTGRQDVVSSDRMCWSCHDGFVMDSRLVWAGRGHSHPVGVVPTDRVQIPMREGKNQFPLNDEGKVYCGTCHSAHGVDWEGVKRSKIFLRMPNVDSSLCVACHLERSTGPAEGNHPVYKVQKEKPAALAAAGSRFNEKGELICESCHRIHGAAERKILVMPNDSSQLCGTCHSDRFAKDLAQAGKMGTHPVNVKPDKVAIPQDIFNAGGKLGTGGTLICQTCHRPHFAEDNARLLVQRNPQSQLCQSCHQEQKSVLEGKHNLAKLDRPVTNRRNQNIEQAGVCAGCHLPHGGAGPKMAAQDLGDDRPPEGISAMCLSCHRGGGIADAKQVGEHSHPVGRDLARLPGHTDLPGFSRDGLKTAGKGLVSCATCHDPHQGAAREGAAPLPDKLLRKANDAQSTLCRGCHSDKDGIANTKHDLTAMAPDTQNIEGQAPSQAGICGSCHLPHNGQGPRMWARNSKEGVDPVSSTCLSCHDEKGIAREKLVGGISHPIGVSIDRVGVVVREHQWERSDGGGTLVPLPLYNDKGVPTAEGGNVTCGACHDPHRWSVDKGLDAGQHPKDIKGSPRSRFLRMPLDGESTLCANCHGNKAPVARSKHNLAISAATAQNANGKTVAESGTCGACHQPHNAHGPKLWARDSGKGGDEIERRCTACHKEDGVAGKKLTGAVSHPLAVDVAKIGGQTSLPLFKPDGTRDPATGKVSCATCHEPHQWKPRDPASASGADAKVEGGAADSFLRLPAAPEPTLCADCHRDKRWVNGTDHDLRVTAPEAVNKLGQTASHSGVCSQCHVPHNAPNKSKLWARDLGPGEDPMERLCRSCHTNDGIAEHKQPVKAQHPSQVMVLATQGLARTATGSPSSFPVYNAEGDRDTSGKITCPTCHNPHQWSPTEQKEGEGRNVEGDARNSFLRSTSEYALCVDCHGLDALFRYKYFHGEQSRKKHKLYR